MRRSNDPFRNFDRNFNIMRRFVFGFIALVFLIIVVIFGVTGWAVFQVASDPEGAAESAGRILGSVVRGLEETR